MYVWMGTCIPKIPSLYTSSSSLLCSASYGEDLTPVKICNCNGPTDGVPSWSDCGR
jgi:hypothetical protein